MSSGSYMLRHARSALQCARVGASGSAWAFSRYATAAVDEAESKPSSSGALTLIRTKQLTAASVGAHYLLDEKLVPEASRAYAAAFYAPRDPGHERKGGCRALQQEVEATGSHAIMYRPVLRTLYKAVKRCTGAGPGSATAAAEAVEAASGPAGTSSGPEAGRHAEPAVTLGRQRLLLTGPSGVGKSIALVGLVEWARQNGWLVFYVPSCLALVRGGYFSRRPSAPRLWDTLTSAQQLLKGLVDAHGARLRQLTVRPDLDEGEAHRARARAAGRRRAAMEATGQQPAESEAGAGAGAGAEAEAREQETRGAEEAAASAERGEGAEAEAEEQLPPETLYDVAAYGLMKDDDPEAAVDSVLSLVRQLIAASASASSPAAAEPGSQAQPLRVLFALDDYNCLFGVTDYGALQPGSSPQLGRRRVLHSDELVLARGMRLLDEAALGGAVVVAANMSTPPMPAPRPYKPAGVPYTELPVPPYSEAEVRNALAHYHATGHARVLATSHQARQLHALTQGSARQLREHAATLGLNLA